MQKYGKGRLYISIAAISFIQGLQWGISRRIIRMSASAWYRC